MYASDVLFVATLFLAKLSVVLLYKRLSSDPKLVRAATVLMVATPSCGFAAVILTLVPTSGSAPWRYDRESNNGKVSSHGSNGVGFG